MPLCVCACVCACMKEKIMLNMTQKMYFVNKKWKAKFYFPTIIVY